MVFGIFDDWNAKIEKQFEKKYPFIKALYIGASLTKHGTQELRDRLKVPQTGALHRHLLVFYLGAIEGDIRKAADMSMLSQDNLVELVFIVALYVATKDKEISSDAEWGAYASECNQVLFDRDNEWYRKCGLGYAGLLGEDSEENWSELELAIMNEQLKEIKGSNTRLQ